MCHKTIPQEEQGVHTARERVSVELRPWHPWGTCRRGYRGIDIMPSKHFPPSSFGITLLCLPAEQVTLKEPHSYIFRNVVWNSLITRIQLIPDMDKGPGKEVNRDREIDKTRFQTKIRHSRKTIQTNLVPLSEIDEVRTAKDINKSGEWEEATGQDFWL